MNKNKLLEIAEEVPHLGLRKLEEIWPDLNESLLPLGFAVYGTLKKRVSKIEEAHGSLAQALRLAQQQNLPASEVGEFLLRSSAVSGTDCDIQFALGLAREALWKFSISGDKNGIGRALVEQGQWQNRQGNLSGSEEAFRASVNFLNDNSHNHLFAAYQGLAVLRYQNADLEQSQHFLLKAKKYAALARSQDQTKIDWLEFWLAEAMGESGEAFFGFVELFEQLRAGGNIIESALAGLEACRIGMLSGQDIQRLIPNVCGLALDYDSLPPQVEAALVSLFRIREGSDKKDINALLEHAKEGTGLFSFFSRHPPAPCRESIPKRMSDTLKDALHNISGMSPRESLRELMDIRVGLNEVDYVVWLSRVGTAKRQLSRLAQARHHLALALQEGRRLQVGRDIMGDILLRSGSVAGAEGEFILAYGLAKEALFEFVMCGSVTGVGRSLVELGQWLNHLGDIETSLECFNSAEIFLEATQTDVIYSLHVGKSIVYYQQSDSKRALHQIQKAHKYLEDVEPRLGMKILWIEAWLLEEIGEYPRAANLFMTLFEYYGGIGDLIECALAGLESCRLLALAGRDISGMLERLFIFFDRPEHQIPRVIQSALMEISAISHCVKISDLDTAIKKLRRAPEEVLAPMRLSR